VPNTNPKANTEASHNTVVNMAHRATDPQQQANTVNKAISNPTAHQLQPSNPTDNHDTVPHHPQANTVSNPMAANQHTVKALHPSNTDNHHHTTNTANIVLSPAQTTHLHHRISMVNRLLLVLSDNKVVKPRLPGMANRANRANSIRLLLVVGSMVRSLLLVLMGSNLDNSSLVGRGIRGRGTVGSNNMADSTVVGMDSRAGRLSLVGKCRLSGKLV